MLITLPAPEKIERQVEVVDVELVPAARLAPKIEQDAEETGAPRSSPQSEPTSAEETPLKPGDESPEAVTDPAEDISPQPAQDATAEPLQQQVTPADQTATESAPEAIATNP